MHMTQARDTIMLLRSEGLRTPTETTISDVVERQRPSHVDTVAGRKHLPLSGFNDVIHSYFSPLCFGPK